MLTSLPSGGPDSVPVTDPPGTLLSMVLLYAHYHRAGVRYADPEDDEG